MVGLARRKDERVIEPILRELARRPVGEFIDFAIEVAEEMADPRLLLALREIDGNVGVIEGRVDEAILR